MINNLKFGNADIFRVFMTLLLFSLSTKGITDEKFDPELTKEWEFEGLTAALKDPDPEVREMAIELGKDLVLIGNKRKANNDYASQVNVFLKDESMKASFRVDALYILCNIGMEDPRFMPELDIVTDLIQGAGVGSYFQGRALSILEQIGESSAQYVHIVAALLDDPKTSAPIRSSAIEALSQMGQVRAQYASKVITLAEDMSLGTFLGGRQTALEMIGEIGEAGTQYADRVAALLDDQDEIVKLKALETLVKMGTAGTQYADRVIALAEDPHSTAFIQNAALSALGKIGGVGTQYLNDKVVQLLDNPDPDVDVKRKALAILKRMGDAGNQYIHIVAALLDDPDIEYFDLLVLDTLKGMGDAGVQYAEKLVLLVEDSDTDHLVRLRALDVLGEIGEAGTQYVNRLAAIAEDLDAEDYIRLATLVALEKIGERGANYIERLIAFVEDSNVDIDLRLEALSILEEIDGIKTQHASRLAALLKGDILLEGFDATIRFRLRVLDTLAAMGEIGAKHLDKVVALLANEDELIRTRVFSFIEEIGEASIPYADILANFMLDESSYDENERINAASALAGMGEMSSRYASKAIALLDYEDYGGSPYYVYKLPFTKKSPFELRDILNILKNSYENPQDSSKFVFQAHLLGGGQDEIETLIAVLGRPGKHGQYKTNELAKLFKKDVILKTFEKSWEASSDIPDLRKDLAWQIADFVREQNWGKKDLKLLKLHEKNLQEAGFKNFSRAILSEIESIVLWNKKKEYIIHAGQLLISHILVWSMLIYGYSKSAFIQATFFWNPWIRRVVGAGYVGFLLTKVSYLRSKLISPFKKSLLSDVDLDNFKLSAYYDQSSVELKSDGQIRLLIDAIPRCSGLQIIEGNSGLGKSYFLKYLIAKSQRPAVYLFAKDCSIGVMDAIYNKLHGLANDKDFLKSIIYFGAIDIYIDGLNEVSPDTRAHIKTFAENYTKANIMLATQPIELEWGILNTAETWSIKPLGVNQIYAFLLTQAEILSELTKAKNINYVDACLAYVNEQFDVNKSPEALEAIQLILSNPMDLTLVAQIIAHGDKPNLFRLQEQLYKKMVCDYEKFYPGQNFPLRRFSQHAYEIRMNENEVLSEEKFSKELQCMEKHKMVFSRQLKVNSKVVKEWFFRHDKLWEFFILQTFLGFNNEKPSNHFGDKRFSGVYELLAILLPIEEAEALREDLIYYAADTKDHSVSDSFIQLLRTRKQLG